MKTKTKAQSAPMGSECRKYTPPQLAKLWGIAPAKVFAWIKSGELRAINAATNPSGDRPRYLIDSAAIEAFEKARAVVEKPASKSRPARKPTHVTTYF